MCFGNNKVKLHKRIRTYHCWMLHDWLLAPGNQPRHIGYEKWFNIPHHSSPPANGTTWKTTRLRTPKRWNYLTALEKEKWCMY